MEEYTDADVIYLMMAAQNLVNYIEKYLGDTWDIQGADFQWRLDALKNALTNFEGER